MNKESSATADDTRNFILPMEAPPSTSDGGGATSFHIPPHCYEKKARRKSSKMNPLQVKKPTLMPENDADAPKIARTCSECGKKFWSWKALFGHMRCHPERQWRGINPPPNFRRPSVNSPSSAPPPPPPPPPSIQTTIGAWPHNHHQFHLPPPPSSDYHCYPSRNIMTEEDHEVAACLLLLANSNNHALIKQQCSGRIGGGTITIREAGEIIQSQQSHKCTICSRVFSSGRALGGHKRFHCRDKFRVHHRPPLAPPHPVVYSASAPNYLDLNLLPIPDPQHDHDHSSSSAAQLALDLRLGL